MTNASPNVLSRECHPPFCSQQELHSTTAGGTLLASFLSLSSATSSYCDFLQAKIKRERAARTRSLVYSQLGHSLPAAAHVFLGLLLLPRGAVPSLRVDLEGCGEDWKPQQEEHGPAHLSTSETRDRVGLHTREPILDRN